MQHDHVEPFTDNWTYLKAELLWLDRLLSLTIARQRQETRQVDRVAHDRGDRVSSHWWKGLVTLEGEIGSDSPAQRPRAKSSSTYQQQLDAKIQVSQHQGIRLGLPQLCSQLQLSRFEKNLVLMALAPEISRRYSRIYNYLQETEAAIGLPTVDLLLRLLCRNDAEWQTARQSLLPESRLLRDRLVQVLPQTQPLLTRWIKLSDSVVDFLLSEPSDGALLPGGLSTAPAPWQQFPTQPVTHLTIWTPPAPTDSAWSGLVLPAAILTALQRICHQIQFAPSVDSDWGFAPTDRIHSPLPGAIVLLAGRSGTGKTTAACAIAQTLQTPLAIVDLAALHPDDYGAVRQELQCQTPKVLLLKSAQIWFGRSSPLLAAELHQFFNQRQQHRTITVLSVERSYTVQQQWRRNCQRLEIPLPDQPSRLRLWQQAFPAQVPLDPAIDWQWLARQPLTGGQIQAIAREAALIAAADSASSLTMAHLSQTQEFTQTKPKQM